MNIKLPDRVKHILQKLYDNNYDAYVVGGCVRDCLLGIEPKDWDITTDALPGDIRRIFGEKHTIPTGIKYGTVTVLVEKEGFEVTTYRVDLSYSDGRRPDEVRFTPSLDEELGRRDFTINAMAYNENNGLVDLFGGRVDLNNRIIRCVGNPDDRFNEDALRMMRAVRFAAQLDFDIEEGTFKSICKNGSLLQKISAERINAELGKTLISQNPIKTGLLFLSGLAGHIIPEAMDVYNAAEGKIVMDTTLRIIAELEPLIHLRMPVLLHGMFPGCDEQAVSNILKRLKYDNAAIEKVKKIIRFYDVKYVDKASVKKCLSIIGYDSFTDIIKIRDAYIKAGVPGAAQCSAELENTKNLLDEITSHNECCSTRTLAVNGSDLINIGLSGAQIGEALRYLLDIVISDPGLNVKGLLLDKARNLYKAELQGDFSK